MIRTYISLFSGCGGFDKGFMDNGFKCLGAFDIEQSVVDVFNKNLGNYSTVHDLSKGVLPYAINEKVDVVISGSPCQGFSTVGKRQIGDPRNKLLMIGGEIAVKLGTDYFIAENVMGSIAGEFKLYWDKLESYMIENGYQVRFFKCDTTKIGLPQSRKRVIMVASKKNATLEFINPNLSVTSLNDVFQIIEDIPNHDKQYLKEDSIDFKIASKIKPGQKLSNVRGGERSVHSWDIPEVFGEISIQEREILLEVMSLRRKIRRRKFGDADPVDVEILKSKFSTDISHLITKLIKIGYLKHVGANNVDLVQTFNGKYRRLLYSGISPTVDTRFGNPKYFLHPEEHRPITVREAARIQGFPDDFIFFGSKSQQYKMIGNAVPPLFSNWIASEVLKHLNQTHE